MSKPCHQLVEVRGPKGRAGPDVWQVVVGHCVLPFTHSTDGWSDKKSDTKRENNCSFSHRPAPCPWPLLALIWPCVPIEKNGKPLLTWTGHILAYTDTCWHNTGYIFANFLVLFSDLLDSVLEKSCFICLRMHIIPLLKVVIFCHAVSSRFFLRKHSLVHRKRGIS